MSAIAIIGAIARPAVRFGVSASAVPIHLAERVRGDHDDERWPPALAVEGFQASVLQTAGSLLDDDELRVQGRLLAEKVDRLRTAAALEIEAEEKLQQADAERALREEAATRQRDQAAAAAKEKKAAAARRARERKRAAQDQAAQAGRAAEEARSEAEQRIEEQQRAARAKAITTERKAVAKEKAAAAAERKAAATDARIKATNQARKA